ASTIASSEALEALRRRAREIAAEAVEPTPPSLVAARARAAAMAAHPSSYGQRMRARMAAEAQVRGSASANVPMAVPRTAAEQAAARILAAGDIAATASAQLDVADVLQRRRVG
ncbi:MAG TPA: hypothetical protein VK139_00375, partial [Microbacteriaceae bacterium]|nr:hypothetical protein [Microbacteriaceae bacterium]